MQTPEILGVDGAPAIVHASDYSLVSSAKPARAGETLTLLATGLGPTRPGVDPGQVFTASPLQLASSPIGVLVNEKSGDVLYAGGVPDKIDQYQVNFRMPGDTAPGVATIQLTAAWTSGGTARIPVQ